MTGVAMKSLRVPLPDNSYLESFGLQSNFQFSLPLRSNERIQPSPPGKTTSLPIMSSFHFDSPVFTSAQTTSQRLLTKYMRSPSTWGLEQMPSRGQSTTRPPGSFSKTDCHWKLPLASSKHMMMPRSTGAPFLTHFL